MSTVVFQACKAVRSCLMETNIGGNINWLHGATAVEGHRYVYLQQHDQHHLQLCLLLKISIFNILRAKIKARPSSSSSSSSSVSRREGGGEWASAVQRRPTCDVHIAGFVLPIFELYNQVPPQQFVSRKNYVFFFLNFKLFSLIYFRIFKSPLPHSQPGHKDLGSGISLTHHLIIVHCNYKCVISH